MFTRGRWELKVSKQGIFFHAWLSIPSGKQVLTPQGKQRCGEVDFFHAWLSIPSGKQVLTPQKTALRRSGEGIDSQDGESKFFSCLAVDTFRQGSTDTSGKTVLRWSGQCWRYRQPRREEHSLMIRTVLLKVVCAEGIDSAGDRFWWSTMSTSTWRGRSTWRGSGVGARRRASSRVN